MDCYNEYEQIAGWACILDERIKTPCTCKIGKEQATLKKVDTDDNGNAIVGIITLNKTKMRVLIQDINIDTQKGMDAINAYKYWCNGSGQSR